jgi:hypothetical protein
MECIAEIAEKAYYLEDLNLCKAQSFDSDKMICLKGLEFGQLFTGNPALTVEEFKQLIKAELLSVEADINAGRIRKALMTIIRLIVFLS